MELRVLGPVQVLHGGVPLPLGPPKQQVVLAMLAVNAGRAVSLDALVEELWGERPPESAVPHVRGYAAALRRLIRRVEPDRDPIVRAGSGYRLDVEPGELDLAEFERDVREGRRAMDAGDLPSAQLHLEQAASRWYGRMLDGVPLGPALSARCTGVEQERAAAIDCLAETCLRQGQADQAVDLLQRQVQADPLREQPYGLLMQARYRIDGVSGALEVYDTARKVLAEQLGVEPGEELQRLHRAVLNRDPVLAQAPAAPAAVAPAVPRELPAQAACFVGRQAEMATVRAALAPADEAVRGRPAVVVLYGPGGVGKSALAVRAGHELAQQYHDGQLYIDLLGATPGLRPVSPVAALGRLLRGVGVSPAEVPPSEEDAAARWRTVTADRRLLVLLDNAADARHVSSLVPAASTMGVLVTSRQPLSSLDAGERLRLAALSDLEGLELLTGLTGRRPVDTADAGRIVGACGNLPLAVRIAAGRLASRPDLPARDYAERLTNGQRRLDELQLDGLAVRACIRTGYDALVSSTDPVAHRAARAFRALGLLNVPDVALGVVAAMLNEQDADLARAALDHLVDVQLLEPVAGGRYRLHDLVRLVATELATNEDPQSARDHTLYRAIAYYTGALLRAEKRLRKGRVLIFGRPELPAQLALPDFIEPAQARMWVDGELSNVVAVHDQMLTTHHDAARLTLWSAHSLWVLLDVRNEWRAASSLGQLMAVNAERGGDSRMKALSYLLQGRSAANAGDSENASRLLERALDGMLATENQIGVVLALMALGVLDDWRGRSDDALTHYRNALRFAEGCGSKSLQAAIQQNMSTAYALTGQLDAAVTAGDEAIAIKRAMGDQLFLGGALINVAVALCLQGSLAEALLYADEAIMLCREVGDTKHECDEMVVRSEIYLRYGNLSAAAADVVAVLILARKVSNRYAMAAALRQQAKIEGANGRWHDAARIRARASDKYALLATRKDPLIERLLSETEPAWLAGLQKQGELAGQQTDLQARAGHEAP